MNKNKLSLAIATLIMVLSSSAFAQSAEGGAANEFNAKAFAALAAGIGIGLAVLGGALGQGRAVAAALEGIGRNPGAASRMLTPMILGLALIESLVLFGFVISYMLTGKV